MQRRVREKSAPRDRDADATHAISVQLKLRSPSDSFAG